MLLCAKVRELQTRGGEAALEVLALRGVKQGLEESSQRREGELRALQRVSEERRIACLSLEEELRVASLYLEETRYNEAPPWPI